jgi:rubrerythrin
MKLEKQEKAMPQPRAAAPRPPASGGPRLELRCLGCGYGAVTSYRIRCPMCGGDAWNFAEWRPFRR